MRIYTHTVKVLLNKVAIHVFIFTLTAQAQTSIIERVYIYENSLYC